MCHRPGVSEIQDTFRRCLLVGLIGTWWPGRWARRNERNKQGRYHSQQLKSRGCHDLCSPETSIARARGSAGRLRGYDCVRPTSHAVIWAFPPLPPADRNTSHFYLTARASRPIQVARWLEDARVGRKTQRAKPKANDALVAINAFGLRTLEANRLILALRRAPKRFVLVPCAHRASRGWPA